MGFRKKTPRQASRGDPVLYVDKHGKSHAGLLLTVRDDNSTASIVYVGFRGALVTAYTVPRSKAGRRGDHWDLFVLEKSRPKVEPAA